MQDKQLNKRLSCIDNRLRALEERGSPRENQQEAEANKNDSNTAPHETPRQPALVLEPPEEKPKPKQKRKKPKFWGLVKKFGVVAGILYAFVNYWQWRDVRRNFAIDERGWVSFQDAKLMIPYDQDHLGVLMRFTNLGKTPVTIERVDTRISESIAPFTERRLLRASHAEEGKSIGPNSSFPFEMVEDTGGIGESKFGDMQQGKMRHEMSVTIWYVDAFGDHHSTDTCICLIGPKEFLGTNMFPFCSPNFMD